MQDILPSETIKQDKMLCHAHDIAKGKAGEFFYCLEENKFYVYEKGQWIHIFEIELLSRISRKILEITRYTLPIRKQILDNFKLLKYISLDKLNWTELINLNNGMMNPNDGMLMEHDPMFYSTNRLPYAYKEDAKCELWIKTITEIFEGDIDKLNILQEFFGYCLTRDTKQHKALLLLGESRSGKSTIIQTLRNVIGTSNCSSVPLKYLSNAQYSAMLINKLVNIDTDVSAKAEQFEAEFKTITSGEPVSVNQKYIAAFDFVPYCKIVMAANIFPKITDHSSAFYNRLIIIPCDRVFDPSEQNRNLSSELLNELSGILNWAIKGLERLNNRGRFENLDFMKDAVQQLENENNPVYLFFEEHVENSIDDSFYILKSDLYSKYVDWSRRTNNYVLSQNRLSSCITKVFAKTTPKNSRLPGNGKWIWKNIKYVEFKGDESIKTNINWQDK